MLAPHGNLAAACCTIGLRAARAEMRMVQLREEAKRLVHSDTLPVDRRPKRDPASSSRK